MPKSDLSLDLSFYYTLKKMNMPQVSMKSCKKLNGSSLLMWV